LGWLDDLWIEVWTRHVLVLEELVCFLLEDEVLVRLVQEVFLSVVCHLLISPELRMESLNHRLQQCMPLHFDAALPDHIGAFLRQITLW